MTHFENFLKMYSVPYSTSCRSARIGFITLSLDKRRFSVKTPLGSLLHGAHFVLWDGQLSKGAAVSGRIVRPGRHSAAHRDTCCYGGHFPCLTLCC